MPAVRTRNTHPAVRCLFVSLLLQFLCAHCRIELVLEVSTAPVAPSLTISAPTPRTFTFPVAHNLADSPFSSPSNPPFEVSYLASPESAPSQHDECSTPPPASTSPGPIGECRPKKGDNGYVKRPENAWILFRRELARSLSPSHPTAAPTSTDSGTSQASSSSLESTTPKAKQRQAELSKIISQRWKALLPDERAHWDALAREKKREHERRHPDYVYRPRRPYRTSASGSTITVSSSTSATTQPRNDLDSLPPSSAHEIDVVVPTRPAQDGSSASVPTPPPYQTFQIPNVYFESPSSATSDGDGADFPTLMALISQFGVANGDGGFDYVPTTSTGLLEVEGNQEVRYGSFCSPSVVLKRIPTYS
jgi:hypothetical protein